VAAAVNGKVYVVGGRFEGGFQSQQADTVEIYDPRTNAWTRGAAMPKPRGGINGVEAMGCLHIFGGEFATGVHPDHEVYNPVTDTWTSMAPMPVPVHGVTGAVFLDGLIYLAGGGTSQGGSSGSTNHQVYRPGMACR
jgi:N-acetylneuraminic acid mutarotase